MNRIKTQIATIQNMTAGFAIIWGGFVANPYTNLFDRTPILYSPMLSLVPYEAFWGGLFILIGLSALIFNWYKQTGISALILSIIYIFFSALYALADLTSPAWALYGLLALFNFLCFKWND